VTAPRTSAPARYDCWLFDLDGVLVDTTACHARAFEALWRSIGVTGPEYATIAGRRTEEVVREVAGRRATSPDEFAGWVRFKQQHARDCLASVPVAFEDSGICLEALRCANRTLALGTGASRGTTTAILARQGWTRLFAAVVTGDDVTRGKPMPDVHARAIELAHAEPSHTLIIEDSRMGLAAAVATGADVVSVRTGLTADAPNFRGAFPDVRSVLAAHGIAVA
jgi:HAD superfamily hydrolase (TIGR01509 family)